MGKKHTDNPSRAGSLSLIGDALALDFANTSSGRGGPNRLDHLRQPQHVVSWAEHVGVLDPATAERARSRIQSGDQDFAGFLDEALRLRESIHRVAAAVADHARPPQEDLGTIKAACAKAIASSELSPGTDGFRWAWRTDPPGPQTILGPVALSAAGLLREGDLSRLKQCKGEHCGWLFFDMTKNNSRRWCDMAVCGNRQKSRRHRQRRAFTATED